MQFLHRADVVPVFEQVRRKTMPQGVATDGLRQAGPPPGITHRPLEQRLVQVMSKDAADIGINRQAVGRKDELPRPFAAGDRMAAREPRRQEGRAVPSAQIKLMHRPNQRETLLERFLEAPREHGDAVLHPLPLPDHNLMPREVQILHPQGNAFHQTQTTAVEDLRHHSIDAGENSQKTTHLVPKESRECASAAWLWRTPR